MANGKIRFGKQSGGGLALVIPDGVANTEVVLPESGVLATTSNIVGFKNYIINGGFNVNQYPAFSNSYDGYKFDRWLIVGAANIGAADCANLQNGVDGAITRSNKGLYFTKTGTGNAWISQRIEYPTKLSGITVTLSFKAYSNKAMNTKVYFDSYNPTNGTTVNFGSLGQAFTLLVGWNTYSFTFKLPVIDANYANIASYLQLNLELLLGSTTAGAWISDIQLEEGSVATPFENRPYGLELSLCRRYYTQAGAGATGIEESASRVSFGIKFDTPMRTPPTIVVNPTVSWRIAGVNRLNISVSVDGGTAISDSGIRLYLIDNSNGSVAGRPIINSTAANFIIASAEL